MDGGGESGWVNEITTTNFSTLSTIFLSFCVCSKFIRVIESFFLSLPSWPYAATANSMGSYDDDNDYVDDA